MPAVHTPIFIPLTVETNNKAIPLSVQDNAQRIPISLSTVVKAVDGEPYPGPYEVVPGDDPQVLSTKGLVATADIVVTKIPSNYGKITWNGSILTVS